MRVFWLDEALERLEIIYDWLAYSDIQNATTIYNQILEESSYLENSPYIGQKENIENVKFEYRSLIVLKRYKIIYHILNEEIEVVSVWDCRMNPIDNLRDLEQK